MKPLRIWWLICSFVPFAGHGCLWVNGTTIDGEALRVGGLANASRLQRVMKSLPEEVITRRLASAVSEGSQSDKELEALGEISRGNYGEAVKILEEVEREKPGDYGVAANLGTACELNGELDKALKWITESIARNPEAHHGTEWLHVAILKEKIRMRDSRDGKASDFLKIPERFGEDFRLKVGDGTVTAGQIGGALFHQLSERMVFVKPEDSVVAELLFDYALFEANMGILESAVEILDLAEMYGFRDPALLEKTREGFQKRIDSGGRKKCYWGAAAAGIVFLMLGFAYRRKWFFLSGKAYREYSDGDGG